MRPAARCDKLSRMNRRTFLSSVAALPMLSSLQPPQAPPPAPRRGGLKLGTVTYNIAKDWDIPTIIKNLTEAGFDGVELRTTHKHGVEISLSPARARRGAQAVRGLAGEDRRPRHHLRVPLAGPGGRPEEHRRDQGVGEAGRRTSGRRASRSAPTACPRTVPEEKTLEQIGKSLAECGAVRARTTAS